MSPEQFVAKALWCVVGTGALMAALLGLWERRE